MTRDDRLRILALSQKCWKQPQPGGAEHNLEETLTRLSERGHTVHLLVGARQDEPTTQSETVTIHSVGPSKSFGGPADVVAAYLAVSIAFYWYTLVLSPHVVYTVNSPLPWPILTRRPRVPIYHHLAVDEVFETHPFPLDYLLHGAQRLGLYVDRSSITISVSPSTTDTLVTHGHDPASVVEIRNGVEIGDYSVGDEADEPHLLFLGGHQRYKGADRLPALHSAISERFDCPIHLDVAGREGPLSDDLRDYCSRTEDARFHGYVSEDRKRDLLRRSWLLLAPSRVEGWGIVVLEANACQTPAVGADVPGLRDSIRDDETGLLRDASPIGKFVDGVESLVRDDARRARLGSNARDWAREHSWEAAADRLEAVFEEVAAA